MASGSAERLQRLVTERHEKLRRAIDALGLAVTLENRDAKIKAAQGVLDSLAALGESLAASDHTPWMGGLKQAVERYIQRAARDEESGRRLLGQLEKLRPQINSERWGFTSGGVHAVEFSVTYNEFYAESRAPELFDELVAELEQVINSGEVDSRRALEAIEGLLATVKANARVDMLAAYYSLEFVKRFLQNYLFALLEENKVLKPLIKAFKKTVDQLDAELRDTQEKASAHLKEVVQSRLPVPFDYRPPELPSATELEVDDATS